MKYLPLLWSQLWRSRTRTLLTLLSVIAAFVLFGLLDSVRVAFKSAGSVDGVDRLVVSSRVSITQSLPLALLDQIAAVPGVGQVTYAMWFGGIYRDVQNFFPSFSVAPNYFALHRNLDVPAAQLEAFDQTRSGAIVGQALAEEFGWKLGDTLPLQATIFPRGGSNDWPLQLVGIFRSRDRSIAANAERQLMLHWSYFDEANDYVKSKVGWFTVGLDGSVPSDRVIAAIDALSANSDHETRSQTESAWQQAFVRQFADIDLIVRAIMGAVFFTLLLLTGNTLAQALRRRIPELATLKALGFNDATVAWLVLLEALLLIGLGGVLGLALARALLPLLSARSLGMLPVTVPAATWLAGLVAVVLISLIVGLPPALRTRRLRIVDALAGR